MFQNDQFKSSAKIIHTLMEVVAKVSSLLLGLGPKPDGTLPETAIQRLEEIGKWTKLNGEAIYNTRITSDYKDGNTYFTKSKTGNVKFALVCLPENSNPPTVIQWKTNIPKKGVKIKLLQTGETVKWTVKGDEVEVDLPKSVTGTKPLYAALAFSFVGNEK
jgi:alpha-L-fucosidase